MALIEKKVTEFNALSSLDGDEVIYAVDDPAGTPADRSVTANTLSSFVQSQIILAGDTSQKHFDYFLPMSGIATNFTVAGQIVTEDTGQTGDYTTDFSGGSQHLCILVNSIITGGDIIITGTSNSESDGVPVTGDTETITIDTTAGQYYQTSKKWLEVTNIDISSGTIATINYDILLVGYLDRLNVDFEVIGFRAEFTADSNSADCKIRIQKVQDDGNNKMSLVDMEVIGFDSTVGGGVITDSLRTGANDRSHTFGQNMLASGNQFVMKYNDYPTYFSGDENIIEAGTKDEGIIILFEGEPSGGISGVEHCVLNVFYRSID